jgi:hypothetical protein
MAQGKPPAKAAPAKAPAKPAPATPAKTPAKPAAAAPKAPAQPAAKPAAAPMNEKQKKDAARKAYEDGMKKLDAKDYAGALVDFKRADELLPAAAAKHKIGLSYDGLGQVPEAIAAFEAFLAVANPEKQQEQIDQATRRVGELKQTPGSVRLASDPADASVEIDGQAQMGVTPMDLKLAPGTHKVRVSAPGYQPVEQEIEIKAAQQSPDLTLTLTRQEATPVAPPIATAPPAPVAPAPAPAAEEKSNLPAYVVLGLAGAGAVVGGIFGVKALGDKSDFDKNPTTDRADAAERNALIADMAFGVAVTLGVTGTVLLLSGKSSPQQKGLAPKQTKTMQLTPFVSPHSAGAGAVWRF